MYVQVLEKSGEKTAIKKNLVPYVSDRQHSTYKTNIVYKIQKGHEI